MSKYRVLVTDSNEFLASFDDYYEAEEAAKQFAVSTDKETCVMEVISTHNPFIGSYEEAMVYLRGDAKNHQKALLALEKLIVIAEAWNKQDGFVPDYSNDDQYKCYPWFKYDHHTAGFAYTNTFHTTSFAHAIVGSRLCFKTEKRSEQFGKQFIDLWNDYLLFR